MLYHSEPGYIFLVCMIYSVTENAIRKYGLFGSELVPVDLPLLIVDRQFLHQIVELREVSLVALGRLLSEPESKRDGE